MAFALLSHDAHDLALGKPPLFWLASSTPVRDAFLSLKLHPHLPEISVWSCSSSCSCSSLPTPPVSAPLSLPSPSSLPPSPCRCVGKICMLRLLCYLSSESSLRNPSAALDAPVSVVLDDDSSPLVLHLDADASLLEALDGMVSGAQNLVLQISQKPKRASDRRPAVARSESDRRKPVLASSKALMLRSHDGNDYCWVTHEDALRFFVGYIGNFSPLPLMSIEDLGIIQTDILKASVDQEASAALEIMKKACVRFRAVAVVDCLGEESKLLGEISCASLQACDETAALALATLSVEEFLSYVQGGWNRSAEFVESMRIRLCEKLGLPAWDMDGKYPFLDLSQMLKDMETWENSSSDEESGAESPKAPHELLHKWHSHGDSLPTKARNGDIVCCRRSNSLIAVIMQALVRREDHVWVTMEDGTLVGIVTLVDMLGVLLNHLKMLL